MISLAHEFLVHYSSSAPYANCMYLGILRTCLIRQSVLPKEHQKCTYTFNKTVKPSNSRSVPVSVDLFLRSDVICVAVGGS